MLKFFATDFPEESWGHINALNTVLGYIRSHVCIIYSIELYRGMYVLAYMRAFSCKCIFYFELICPITPSSPLCLPPPISPLHLPGNFTSLSCPLCIRGFVDLCGSWDPQKRESVQCAFLMCKYPYDVLMRSGVVGSYGRSSFSFS